MDKKLQLSKDDKIIAGVCGGIANYFSIDPNVVRIIWIIIGSIYGIGLLSYIVCWVILPIDK